MRFLSIEAQGARIGQPSPLADAAWQLAPFGSQGGTLTPDAAVQHRMSPQITRL